MEQQPQRETCLGVLLTNFCLSAPQSHSNSPVHLDNKSNHIQFSKLLPHPSLSWTSLVLLFLLQRLLSGSGSARDDSVVPASWFRFCGDLLVQTQKWHKYMISSNMKKWFKHIYVQRFQIVSVCCVDSSQPAKISCLLIYCDASTRSETRQTIHCTMQRCGYYIWTRNHSARHKGRPINTTSVTLGLAEWNLDTSQLL